MHFGDTAADVKQIFDTITTVSKAASGDPMAVVESIEVHTRWLPPIVIKQPLVEGDGGPSPVDAVAKTLKPKILMRVKGLPNPLEYAPAGDPGQTQWPKVRTGLILGGLGLALAAFLKLRK